MGFWDIFTIAIGLSMDAAAVAMSNGICMDKPKFKTAFLIAFLFGLFQGIMPLIGYFAGSTFSSFISNIDHWVAFGLLLVIGGKMIADSFKSEDQDCKVFITIRLLLVQAIATSIDALAVGVTFAVTEVNILNAVSIIALTTFAISLASVYIGKKFGNFLESKAELLGGIILVGIGIKILIEHLFF